MLLATTPAAHSRLQKPPDEGRSLYQLWETPLCSLKPQSPGQPGVSSQDAALYVFLSWVICLFLELTDRNFSLGSLEEPLGKAKWNLILSAPKEP